MNLHPIACAANKKALDNACRERGEPTEIQQGRMPVQESQPPFAPGKTPPHAPFKLRQSFIKQIESDASFTTIVRGHSAPTGQQGAPRSTRKFSIGAPILQRSRRHRSRVAKSLRA